MAQAEDTKQDCHQASVPVGESGWDETSSNSTREDVGDNPGPHEPDEKARNGDHNCPDDGKDNDINDDRGDGANHVSAEKGAFRQRGGGVRCGDTKRPEKKAQLECLDQGQAGRNQICSDGGVKHGWYNEPPDYGSDPCGKEN
ncbi:MAG: hypothetical protein UX47_C0006G0111 [Candidatus Collierbacteria bacterium GW2011_GWA2_46_26]|uniref:Uncharacterized protein n=1 Tax=Candidatus Collierbacteria bacterium GW2011_GWA2_46_26 TaxID=1618381 RepID=A0A0G1SIK9_9BACT|nr:MAG: hypothetical protein UW29_C0005G0026 [Candidatus Collierbacteria bacterium GW2011_GWC2_44_13]KKU33140.1 MAG: hypothetical protein UX47_C0006G0111 [Candidatus Collierbacteria bacterium GW2011_GWA2_46_26]